MSLMRVALFGLGIFVCACGEHYEGGGRRGELPMSSQAAGTLGVAPGDGSISVGGTSGSLGTGDAGAQAALGGAP